MSVHYRKLVSNPLLHACQNAPGKNINKFTVIISRYPKKIKYRRLPVHKWRINRDTIRRWIRLLQSLRPKVWGLPERPYYTRLWLISNRSFRMFISWLNTRSELLSLSASELFTRSPDINIFTSGLLLGYPNTSRGTACYFNSQKENMLMIAYRIYKINSFFIPRTSKTW